MQKKSHGSFIQPKSEFWPMVVRLTSVAGWVSTYKQNNQVRDQFEHISMFCEAIHFK